MRASRLLWCAALAVGAVFSLHAISGADEKEGDPGDRPADWPASSVQAAARPLTELAARAIAAGRKGDELDPHGVIVEPYRNYRGAEVIGAWRWLSKYGMGVRGPAERSGAG